MKLLALRQSYMNRRSGSQRGGLNLDSSPEGAMLSKSGTSVFWLCVHCLCCLISLVLGFRFSHLLFFLFLSGSSPSTPIVDPSQHLVSVPNSPIPSVIHLAQPPALKVVNRSKKVVAGRHGILIRPWPHPDPVEVMRAHEMIRRVQLEQRLQLGIKEPREVIVITPTYVRTFQKMHLSGLMHSLMLAPCKVLWIIVEAGGQTNETASIVSESGLRVIHIGFQQRMPSTWEGRNKLESKMRIRALREVKARKLDGIIVFGDDSNMHSIELFDEIQNVKWFGALSIGVLTLSDDNEGPTDSTAEEMAIPVQGPACNSSKKLVGWHAFNKQPYNTKNAVYIDDFATVLPRKFEWAGFVMNSRLLWSDEQLPPHPSWFKDLDSLIEDIESPLSLLKDQSVVEPLGNCGKQVLLWWLRVEARFDSRYPPGWVIDPPLEITVAAKETPWTADPELPSEIEQTSRRSSRGRSSRAKHRGRRRHEGSGGDRRASAN